MGRETALPRSGRAGAKVRRDSFEDFFENGAVALHLVGDDGTILRANKAELDLLGYSAEEYIGHSIADFHVDREVIEDILARLKRGETLQKYPARLRARDGSIKHVQITSSGQFRDGEFLNSRCFTVDTTELERASESAARRMAELAALYRFTDELHRAESLAAVYDAALDAILSAVGCNRASILLFDESGVMRFVAWRGLSDAYRQAVDGHSPWTPDEKDPQPICIGDIDLADVPDSLKRVVRTEGIRALGFIPLVVHGRLIGKFMTYYEAPHVFAEEELEIALTTARQVAFGVDRKRSDEARRRTEEELRRNEERLRLATQTGKIGLWEWDIPANRVSWTDSHYAIHGVKKEEFAATAESFLALVHPDDRDRVSTALQQSLLEDAPYELEFRAVRPDGVVLWLFTNALILRDGGKPLRMLGATLDITERKQAEDRFRLAVEAAPSGMLLSDGEGRIVVVNAHAETLFGYTRDELLGQPVETLIPERFRRHHPALRGNFGRQPEVRAMGAGRELFALRKDGTEVPVEIGLSPITTEQGLFVLSAIVDITERKRAADREKMLTREVEHRSNNLLAVIQSIVGRSLAGKSLSEAKKILEARLHSLARTHRQLIDGDWSGLDLSDIARSELEPFAAQISIDGCHVVLSPQQAQNFALALHELATNAAKYGALSSPSGHIRVSWSVTENGSAGLLNFAWRERGGPAVATPQQQGFGTALLKGAFARSSLEYAPEGLSCEIELPLKPEPKPKSRAG